MHVLVINLASSTDRKLSMAHQLKALELPHTFIDAVNGKGKEPQTFAEYPHEKRMQLMGRAMTGTEVACTLSHLKAMQFALEQGLERVCILEDDGILKPNFKSQLQYAFNLPKDFEFLSLYNNKVKDSKTRQLKRSRYKQWSGALGYVLTADAIRKILTHNEEVIYIADQAIMGRPEMGVKVWYLLPKAIQLSDELESDIGDARNKRSYTLINRLRRTRFQFISWLRRTLYVLVHLKEYLVSPTKKS